MDKLVEYSFDSNCGVMEMFYNKIPYVWMSNKKKADDIDGLWRVHDNLYDVTDFINKHPGGKFWLEVTKGTDITEAFECHHLKSDTPERMLKNFYVRKASHPRQSKFTFKDDGFYRTLKRKLPSILKKLPRQSRISCFYLDSLLTTTFAISILANAFSSYALVAFAGLLVACTAIGSHNFAHQADNIRMYVGDLFFVPAKTMRMYHVLSHHMYTNTIVDLHLLFTQPFFNYFPTKKSIIVKYISWMYTPLMLLPFLLHYVKLFSTFEYIIQRKFSLEYMLPIVLPFTMHFFGGHSLFSTFVIWQLILISGSICFYLIAYTSNHLHPEVYIQGDAIRPDEFDWGINQLDTVSDRKEIKGNKLLSLVLFGDHGLHHLFPNLDHSFLDELYPVVQETLEEFNLANVRMTTQKDLIMGFLKRGVLELPNLNPPTLR